MMFKLLIDDHTDLRLLEIRHADDLYHLTNHSRTTLRQWLFWVDFTQSPKDSMITTRIVLFREQPVFQ